MSEYRTLGSHTHRVLVTALLGSREVMAVVAAALEGMGEEIDAGTSIELRIDAIHARIANPRPSPDPP